MCRFNFLSGWEYGSKARVPIHSFRPSMGIHSNILLFFQNYFLKNALARMGAQRQPKLLLASKHQINFEF